MTTALALGQPSTGVGWVWPLPTLCGRAAKVSQGHSTTDPKTWYGGVRPHLGVDVMYARRAGESHKRPQGSGAANRVNGHFMPAWVPVIAAAPGLVAYADQDVDGKHTGATVKVDHRWRPANGRKVATGVPWVTYYTHMLRGDLFVRVGQWVEAGTALGWCRGNPHDGPDGLWHLHFALLRAPAGSRSGDYESETDPKTWTMQTSAWMQRWGRRAFNVDFSAAPARRCAPAKGEDVALMIPPGLSAPADPWAAAPPPAQLVMAPIAPSDLASSPLEVLPASWQRWAGGDRVSGAELGCGPGSPPGVRGFEVGATPAPGEVPHRLHQVHTLFRFIDRELTDELRRRGCQPNRIAPRQGEPCARMYGFWAGPWSHIGQAWEQFYQGHSAHSVRSFFRRAFGGPTLVTADNYADEFLALRAVAIRHYGFELGSLPDWWQRWAALAKGAA